MSWESANRQAATLAAQVQGDLGLDLAAPIDVFGVVRRLGIILAFSPLQQASGLYIPADRNGGPAGVLIHQGHPRARQHYTAGHELGHHFFRHGVEVDRDTDHEYVDTAGTGMSDSEKEAEAFAAFFLMPRRLLRSGIADLGFAAGKVAAPVEAYSLSLWLGTSYTATVRQLTTTKLLDGAMSRDWMRIAPKDIKVGLISGRAMNDYRNDVWWLGHGTHRRPIDVRPGDRIIVRLPENVATGYTWAPLGMPHGLHQVADSFIEQWEPGLLPSALPYGPERPGATTERSLLYAVDDDAPVDVIRMRFGLSRPWEVEGYIDEYELLISVSHALTGVQLSEAELRVAPA